MPLILNIDTATENAIVSISDNDTVIDSVNNSRQKDHAAFLQPAIKDLLEKCDLTINKLHAVAVTAGPGSYTGLRVGMASAKGLCYALNLPLIAINTLEVIALSSIKQINDPSALYCPMIDARRMEVFTAVYDHHLTEIVKPCAMVLTNTSFTNISDTAFIYFSGSGIVKFKEIAQVKAAGFKNNDNYKMLAEAMAQLAYKDYIKDNFANIYSTKPEYLKDFYTVSGSLFP